MSLIFDLISGLKFSIDNHIKISDIIPQNIIYRKENVYNTKLIPIFD